jgi:hypothetical protein
MNRKRKKSVMSLKGVFQKWIAVTVCVFAVLAASASARVLEKDGRIYIIDQTGDKWDITHAKSIGFEPGNFQYGIGRHAFKPLGEGDWLSGPWKDALDFRVIGIASDTDAHAYAVDRLARHETANTVLASRAVLAAY